MDSEKGINRMLAAITIAALIWLGILIWLGALILATSSIVNWLT